MSYLVPIWPNWRPNLTPLHLNTIFMTLRICFCCCFFLWHLNKHFFGFFYFILYGYFGPENKIIDTEFISLDGLNKDYIVNRTISLSFATDFIFSLEQFNQNCHVGTQLFFIQDSLDMKWNLLHTTLNGVCELIKKI